MSRQVPGPGREAHTDVAADLSDPNRLAAELNHRGPQSQMQALVEARAGPLQRKFLLASTEIQRAHRRVAVLRLEQERLGRFPRCAKSDRLGLVPSAQTFLDTGAVAHDNQVERIALDRLGRIAGASR